MTGRKTSSYLPTLHTRSKICLCCSVVFFSFFHFCFVFTIRFPNNNSYHGDLSCFQLPGYTGSRSTQHTRVQAHSFYDLSLSLFSPLPLSLSIPSLSPPSLSTYTKYSTLTIQTTWRIRANTNRHEHTAHSTIH